MCCAGAVLVLVPSSLSPSQMEGTKDAPGVNYSALLELFKLQKERTDMTISIEISVSVLAPPAPNPAPLARPPTGAAETGCDAAARCPLLGPLH